MTFAPSQMQRIPISLWCLLVIRIGVWGLDFYGSRRCVSCNVRVAKCTGFNNTAHKFFSKDFVDLRFLVFDHIFATILNVHVYDWFCYILFQQAELPSLFLIWDTRRVPYLIDNSLGKLFLLKRKTWSHTQDLAKIKQTEVK